MDKGYNSWGFRNKDHPDPDWRNTCFFYKNPFKPYNGNPNDNFHTTSCLYDIASPSNGCKLPFITNGWQNNNNGMVNDKDLGMNSNDKTINSCRNIALEKGFKAWGHRNNSHPDPAWRNTCFFYKDKFNSYSGNPNDYVHTTGCVNKEELLENGCNLPNVVYGWQNNNDAMVNDKDLGMNSNDKTQNDCRNIALEKGFKAWGHRNNSHPDPAWRNTCFFYKGKFKPYDGNKNDNVHTTGCVNEGGIVSKGCN
jgi:hypothetical protein